MRGHYAIQRSAEDGSSVVSLSRVERKLSGTICRLLKTLFSKLQNTRILRKCPNVSCPLGTRAQLLRGRRQFLTLKRFPTLERSTSEALKAVDQVPRSKVGVSCSQRPVAAKSGAYSSQKSVKAERGFSPVRSRAAFRAL